MAEEIITVTGIKGGEGKTATTLLIADMITGMGLPLLAVDSDTGNPGFWKTYNPVQEANPGDGLVVAALDLAGVEAWSGLINFCDDLPGHRVLIDTPAGSHRSFERYAKVLHGSLGDLKRKWTSVFVLGSSRDGMELLTDYVEMMPPDHLIHVVCNHGRGGSDRSVWESYLDSPVQAEVERRGGKTLVLPELAPHVMRVVNGNGGKGPRLTYSGALASRAVSIGDRAVLRMWLSDARAEFKHLFEA